MGQQFEMLIADALDDRSSLVPPFVGAVGKQLQKLMASAAGGTVPSLRRWSALLKALPADVEAAQWEALFEVVVAKLLLWLPTAADLLPFFVRHMDTKFERLVLRAGPAR